MIGIKINIVICDILIGSAIIDIIIDVIIGAVRDIVRGVINIIISIIRNILRGIVNIVIWVFSLGEVIIISDTNFFTGNIRFIFNNSGSKKLLLIFF